MVKIEVKGKEYTLRFDMSVMDYLEEKGTNIAKAMTETKSNKDAVPMIKELFTAMANAANDYLKIPETYSVNDIPLFDKHSSIGWMKTVQTAITQAVKDGSKMQAKEDEDKNVHDLYLKKIEQEEALKN